jgi:hypothetical protein
MVPRPEVGADFLGVVHAGKRGTPAEAALLAELGVSWVAATCYWGGIEKAPGEWDFAEYDRFVDNATALGMKVLGVLAYDTPWIHPAGKGKSYVPPERVGEYCTFVAAVVDRYRGRVGAWEVWNEPNVSVRFWKGPAKDYYALAKAGLDTVRRVDPECPAIAGGFFRAAPGFVKGMFASGALENAEHIAVHPYAVNAKGVLKQYDKFAAMVKAQGFTGEIWVTEVGFPTGGLYPSRTTAKKAPALVTDTLTGLAARGARAVFWYELYDSEKPAFLDSECYFGLADYEGTLKTMGTAFAAWAKN